MAKKKHVNEFIRTESGRFAGKGMIEDSYDDESFPDKYPHKHPFTSLSQPGTKVEVQPVKVYQLSEEELNKYK